MKETRFAPSIALFLLLFAGLAIRLYDLTDPPLDFHPTRQLLSALKARGMYYTTLDHIPAETKNFAVQQWKMRAAIEPEILERIVAFTYRFTGENFWVARIYSALFWVIGGIFLFLLAQKMTSPVGGLAAVSIYLFLPYAVAASRSFQPDPLMTMLIIIFWWAVVKWADTRAFYVALLAGLFGGLAILVKLVAVFFILGGGLGALLGRMTLREALKQPAVYVMSGLGILPAAAYTIYGVFISGYLGQQFSGRFIPALFLSPSYYLGWAGMLNLVCGGFILILAWLGLFFIVDEKHRRFLLGLWAGYALFGLIFNYHISTHDYYSLPLIPIAALSIAPLAAFLERPLTSARPFAILILSCGLLLHLWGLRAEMKAADYRPQAAIWNEIHEIIGNAKTAGLTNDYGTAAAYFGWINLTPWPTSGDLNYHDDLRGARRDFEEQFDKIAAQKDYFIITNFDDFDRQPLLREALKRFPVLIQSSGYIIYDLQ